MCMEKNWKTLFSRKNSNLQCEDALLFSKPVEFLPVVPLANMSTWTDINYLRHSKALGECGSLNENGPHGFMYLYVWFPVGKLYRKDQEVWPYCNKYFTGVGVKTHARPCLPFSPPDTHGSGCKFLATAQCHALSLLCFLPWWLWTQFPKL